MPSLNRTRLDREGEQHGVWRKYPKAPGVELKIAKWLNRDHAALLQKLSVARADEVAEHSRQVKASKEDGSFKVTDNTGVVREINAEALAKTIVRDWRGVTETDEADSPEVPYSWEACYDLLMDGELPFYDDVTEMAASELTFRKRAVETSRGN